MKANQRSRMGSLFMSLTPLAGILTGIPFFAVAVSWVPAPRSSLHDIRLVAFGLIVTAVAIALLGPGAFSLDGYLFGRREIVIPSPSGRPKGTLDE